MPFVAIQCPSCASTDVIFRSADQYECNHCSTKFIRRTPPPSPPAAPPPRPAPVRPPTAPVNSYGPPQATTNNAVTTHVSSVGMRIGWMLFSVVLMISMSVLAYVLNTTMTPTVPSSTPTPAPTPTPTPSATPTATTPTVAATPKPAAAEEAGVPALEGCTCRARTGPVQLHGRVDGGVTFELESVARPTLALPLTSSTAPSSTAPRGELPLGIGCHEDTVLVVSERNATAWSVSKRKALWSRALPEPHGTVNTAAAPGYACRPLDVRDGAAWVPMTERTAKVNLRTGRVSITSTKPRPASAQPSSTPAKPSKRRNPYRTRQQAL